MVARFEMRIPGDESKWISAFDADFEQLAFVRPDGRIGRHIIPLLRFWMDKCIKTHRACQTAVATVTPPDEWRPTRLLQMSDIRDLRSGLMLHEAAYGEYESDVRYIALSHRWASAKQLLLLRSNHDDLRRGVPADQLKTSITEALLIAARLGIEYVWVDTLCIIQDDDKDRTYEILQMDKTYSRATLTIAASDASTDDEGCFLVDKSHVSVACCKVRLDEDQSSDVLHDICVWPDSGLYAVQNSVLAQRGWVFQERLLSPRTLHCCKHQFYWECHTLEASEQQPEGPGEERQYMNPLFKSLLSDQLQTYAAQDPTDTGSEGQEGWRRIVEEYSRGHLTFPEDKLRALEGVRAVWQRTHPGDQYLFGMWRSTILSDLCWLPIHDLEKNKQAAPAHPVAPSWSWASVSLRVLFHAGISPSTAIVDKKTLSLCGIEKIASSDSQTSLGQANGLAALHLSGHLIAAMCGPCFQQEPESIYRRLLQLGEDIQKPLDLSGGHYGPPVGHDFLVLDDIHGVPTGRVYCLPLVIDDETYTLDMEYEASWGLVLVPVLDKDGFFRRIGIFQTYRRGLFNNESKDLYLI